MMIFSYLIILFIALLFSWFSVELCRRISIKYNLVDKPLTESHKQHSEATPILGGLGILIAMVTTCLLLLCYSVTFDHNNIVISVKNGLIEEWKKLITLVVGAIMMFLIGLYDDFYPMKATKKFLCQLVVLSFVSLFGFQISLFIDSSFLNWLITLGWLLFIINSINFFDNMDGLVSGIAIISALFFMIIAIIKGQYIIACLGALTTGVSWGFYCHNKYPAKIFMGDAGSHLLGYLLAVLAGMVTYYSEFDESYLPILSPLFILALPIFDTLTVFTIRKCKGKPIFIGDQNHISHRFVSMGFSKKDSVILIHILQFIFCLLALASIQANLWVSFIIAIQALILLIFIVLLHIKKQNNDK